MVGKITLQPDGYVESVLDTEETADSISEMMIEALKCTDQLSNQGKDIKLFVDATRLIHFDPNAIKRATDSTASIDFDKMVIVGANPDNLEKIRHIVSAAGKEARVAFFDTREEALAWLNP